MPQSVLFVSSVLSVLVPRIKLSQIGEGMKRLANVLTGLGTLFFFGSLVFGYLWSMLFVIGSFGVLGALAGIFLFPVTFVATPIVVGVGLGEWQLAWVSFGGSLFGSLVAGIGMQIGDEIGWTKRSS